MSKIEWTDETWNPVTGCTKISPGCANCYAERMAKRLAGRFGYPEDEPFRVTFHPDRLDQPLRWKKPRRVFVCSMGDLFHQNVLNTWRLKVFWRMVDTNRHTYQVLTKRSLAMRLFFSNNLNVDGSLCMADMCVPWPQEHIWLGVTAEDQKRADERIPLLLQTPAAVRFVSVEPMLGPMDFRYSLRGMPEVSHGPCYDPIWQQTALPPDWIIIGCESGPNRRPCKLEWVRDLVHQCQEAQVPVFVKQLDIDGKVSHDPAEWPDDLRVREYPR